MIDEPAPTPNAVAAFERWAGRANPRFECSPPWMTPYEQLLVRLDRDEAGARVAFEHAVAGGVARDAVRPLWEQRARDERAALVEGVLLRHELAPAPDAAGMARLLALPPGIDSDFVAFYVRHDGAALFQEERNPGHGLFLLPLQAMADEHEALRDWFIDAEDTDADVAWDDPGCTEVYHLPGWYEGCLVFAAYGLSAERYLLATAGPWRGSVLAFVHDEGSLTRVAPSFARFLDDLRTDPMRVVGASLAPEHARAYVSDG